MYCGNELSTGDVGFMCQTCKYRFPEQKPKETSLLYGWICPRCQKVHNWMVQHCDCPPYVITASTIESKEVTEIKRENNCNNCKWGICLIKDWPCYDCDGSNKWEPIKTE